MRRVFRWMSTAPTRGGCVITVLFVSGIAVLTVLSALNTWSPA